MLIEAKLKITKNLHEIKDYLNFRVYTGLSMKKKVIKK